MPGRMRLLGLAMALLVASAVGMGWTSGGRVKQPLAEGTVTLLSVADGYIYSAVPDVGIGGSERLPVAFGAGYGDARALIRFDLSSLPPGGRIVAATLRLTAATEVGPQIQALKIFDVPGPWTEDDLTWERFAGATGELIGQISVTGRSDQVYSVEVTGIVDGWYRGTRQNNGLMVTQLEGLSQDYVSRIWARETGPGRGPQLVITYDAPPTPTPTAAATATPTATPIVVLPTATPTPTPSPTATPRPTGPTKVYLPALLKQNRSR